MVQDREGRRDRYRTRFCQSENLWLAARTCGLRFSHTSLSVVAAADEKGRVQRLPPEQRSGSELNVLAGTAVYAAPPAQAPVRIETSLQIRPFAFC